MSELIGILSQPNNLSGLLSQPDNLHGTLSMKGDRGYSAYEVAVQEGFVGTEEEWLDTLGGFSPIATVSKVGNISTLTVTDANGTTTASILDGVSGFSPSVRNAILRCFANVAWANPQSYVYYAELCDVFGGASAIYLDKSSDIVEINHSIQLIATTDPPNLTVTWNSNNTGVAVVNSSGIVTGVGLGSAVITASSGSAIDTCNITVASSVLTGITATYTQTREIYTTDTLNTLISDLVVTAIWSDGTTTIIQSNDYTLSGTLAIGTSTINVSYGVFSTTFNVTVIQAYMTGLTANYIQSKTVYDTDTLNVLISDLVVTAVWSNGTTTTVSSSNYVLSGTFTAGTSIITATYNGFYDTFNVDVTHTLAGISATYVQSGNVYTTDTLNSLKSDLTVYIVWSDGVTTPIQSNDYVLSGTLSVGTSVITVLYGTFSDTFDVVVTQASIVSITAVYNQTKTVYDVDTLDVLVPDLVVTATLSNGVTRTISDDDYTLSGTLSSATSTITVSYEGYSDTFSVSVTHVYVTGITAIYTQTKDVYNTDTLSSLIPDLVVTALLSNGTTRTLQGNDYVLSGTLSIGTSAVTISYEGATTIFNVTVVEKPLYKWDFTKSSVDIIDNNSAELQNGVIRTSTGLNFNNISQAVRLPHAYEADRAIEIDVTEFDIQSGDDRHVRFVMTSDTASTSGVLIWRYNGNPSGWSAYQSGGVGWSNNYNGLTQKNAFANCTIRIEIDNSGISTLYKDGVLIGSSTIHMDTTATDIWIGNIHSTEAGANLYNVTITGIRIYDLSSAPSSIEAVYTQSSNVYSNAMLDDLRKDLVVTATWSGGVTREITGYVLSGTISDGSCIITVSYKGCDDTFTVNVDPMVLLYNWDFTSSTIDTINENEAELLTGLTRTSSGLNFNSPSQSVALPLAYSRGRMIEIDVTDFDIQDTGDHNVRFVMTSATTNGMLIWRWQSTIGWSSYRNAWSSSIYGNLTEKNSFANSTIRMDISSDGFVRLFKNGVFIGDSSREFPDDTRNLWIGNTGSLESGGNLYNVKITGVRIYEPSQSSSNS